MKMPFSDWSWDQIVLIAGPVLVSLLLAALYLFDLLPIDWPALLVVIALINVAGDVLFALKSEYSVKRGRVRLCNDLVGSDAVAEGEFSGDDRPCQGTVVLAGERWRAVSDRPVHAGAAVTVTGRHGLVLNVIPRDEED